MHAGSSTSPAKKSICPPTETEQKQFFSSLASCTGAKPAVLAIVPQHCDAYVPASLAPELPMVLSDLYHTHNFTLGYHELLQVATSCCYTAYVHTWTEKLGM